MDEATVPVVAILEGVWGEELAVLAQHAEVVRVEGNQIPDDAPWAGRTRALLVRNRTRVTADVLDRLPRLAVVARAGVGLDNIDVAAAELRGVAVVAPLGANARSVAEHTLALALAVARSVVAHDGDTRRGGWSRRPGIELAGRTWGLLGAGATGRATGALARTLGMRVVAHDPYADTQQCAELGIELMELDAAVAVSDVLSCHLPAAEGTRGLVDAHLLARLPAGAIFVNTGRGEVVDEEALADALERGHLLGAGLDVRTQEPPVVGPLERLDNVVLTPHVAGITHESQSRILAALADDIQRVLRGDIPRHRVGGAP